MTRARRAVLAFFTGAALASVGVFLVLGLGAALIVLGCAVAAWSLLLYDVDEEG